MMAPLSVAIVGGGIGGLSAANALIRNGIDVRVYEQAPELAEVGAGVLITPNSLRLLHRMGMAAAMAATGGSVGDGSTYFRSDGTVVAPILTCDSAGWNGMYGMHRADLLNVLATSFAAGRVRTGYRCVGFEQDETGCALSFDNGEQVEADVVIAADGINSMLQQHVVPPVLPVNSGSIAYRGLVAADEIPWWRPGVSQLWMGDGKHFLTYPLRGGRLITYIAFTPSTEVLAESWSAPGDVETLREAFDGWDAPVTDLLARVSTTQWWGLYDREPLTRWTAGRLTLMGDAAHPMLPHLGQGANQSIEDGVALAVHLGRVREGTAVEDALIAYEQQRRPRTSRVQLEARRNGHRYDSRFADLVARDSEIAGSAELRRWLYDYDAEQDAIERVQAGPLQVG